MKRLCAVVLAAGLLAAVGCLRSTTSEPAANTFTLQAPAGTTALKQGESKVVTLSVRRGADFKQAVKLTADKTPPGVKVEFTPPEVKPDAKEAEMKITAEKDAALGDGKVAVKAAPESGSATTLDVPVKVEEAKK